MLGEGRPFIIEFINPKTSASAVEKIQEIRDGMKSQFVQVTELAWVDVSFYGILKESEDSKAKNYLAIVWTKDKI